MSIRITRRQALAGGAALAGSLAMPGLSRAATRPLITHGVQSGDVAHDGAMIWARADRESKMMVEWSTTDTFANATRVQPLSVGDTSDFTGKMLLEGLPSDQDIFYRVAMADLSDTNSVSESVTGHFRTAPGSLRDVSFVWSGDTAGQGWGIDEERGGMTTYATMLGHRPDFMIHSGDTVYADGPLSAEVELKDGTMWKNVMVEEKTKVAETLNEFRAAHKYNMLDTNVRAFNAEVPILYQWDDHEVTNNWYPNETFASDDRYTEKSAAKLFARSAQAFFEMYPIRVNAAEPKRVYRKVSYGPMLDVFFLDMRTYRDDNDGNRQPTPKDFLGAEQIAWLKGALSTSKATWKVIAADMPIGMMVRDGKEAFENMANGDGPVLGREFDIAEVLSFIKHAKVKNTVWLTADVHYTAAHHYSPERAEFQDFEPFWEFVSGPLHAGTFGPSEYDNTFGPKVEFAKAPPEGEFNLPPSDGYQFFGKVDISAADRTMTVSLLDAADTLLWSTTIEPDLA